MITHDLGVISEMADEVIVMYVGKIVEKAKTERLFKKPSHPYTIGVLNSMRKIGRKERLTSIKGSVPSPYLLPEGCGFTERCEHSIDKCLNLKPPKCTLGENHFVYCWKYYKGN